jgi:hypothetical protein
MGKVNLSLEAVIIWALLGVDSLRRRGYTCVINKILKRIKEDFDKSLLC